jgi:uncharacterized protein YbjT (DUF2867 family)
MGRMVRQRLEADLRVLLTGATGLIGSATLAGLRKQGHAVVAVARRGSRYGLVAADVWVMVNIALAKNTEDWLDHLHGVEAVVNCAGVLQDGPEDSTAGVHVEGIGALFAACERAGVRRVVHISAIGVDRNASSRFACTKFAGDQALMDRDLDWVILRPSVVLGKAAYGGSAFLRGLAALPLLAKLPEAGLLQVVQLDDLVATILYFLHDRACGRTVLEIVGPERLTLTDVILAYRQWFGWSKPHELRLPRWSVSMLCRLGDLLGALGWRSPMRSTAYREIVRGAVGDPAEWARITNIRPQSLSAALAAQPVSVQERWFARLYFLKPLVLALLALFWMASGMIALGPGWAAAVSLLTQCVGAKAAPLAALAGATVDILIGSAIAVRRTARKGLAAALAVSALYVTGGAIMLPRLWFDPLGPLLKILPIIALNLVALAILDDR